MAAVAERYLIVTHIKNKESKKRPFRICLPVILCLSSWKNINQKGRNFFVTSWQYSQFGQDGRKKRTFSERWDEYELPVKNLENLAIEKICYYLAWFEIKYLLIFILWITIFIQERVPPTIIYLIKVSNRNTKNKCEIGSKLTIKIAEQLSTVFIVDFGYISHLFLVFLLLFLKK